MSQLTKKTWVITGASSGLGLSIAKEALAQGNRVALVCRNTESVKPLLETYPNLAKSYTLDITESIKIKQIISQISNDFGQIDVLLNNAGYGLVGSLEEYSDEQITQCVQTNFFGHVNILRAMLPIMRNQGHGHILNMSAIAGFANEMGFSIYGASKFALEGLSESIASETRHLGIKVTIIEPGPFRTEFISRSLVKGANPIEAYERSSGKFFKMLQSISGKQAGCPEKAAKLIVEITEAQKPPLRLVLGQYAVDRFNKKLETMKQELDFWKEQSLDCDFAPEKIQAVR